MSISIEKSTQGSTVTLAVAGEVDVSNASELRAQADAVLADGFTGELVVDLSQVPYIDSTGIGVLVGAAHRAQEAGASLAVANPQKNVERVLGLLGVSADLNIR